MNIKVPARFKKATKKAMLDRLRLVDSFKAIMKKYGFYYTDMPRLYPATESFPNGGGLCATDSEGQILSVIENPIAALLNSRESELERVCAYGEVYKFKGNPVNCAYMSAIISGFAGAEVEAEIITAGMDLLRSLGVDTKIYVGHAGVLVGIAETYLNRKVSVAELRGILNSTPNSDIEAALWKLLKEAEAVKGGLNELSAFAPKVSNKVSVSALKSLCDLGEILTSFGLEDKLVFDLSVIGEGFGGLSFELRDDGGSVLTAGGRYDFAGGETVTRCVGFNIQPDYLLSLYPIKTSDDDFDAVIGVGEGIKAQQIAYRLKKSLIESNLSVYMLYRTGKDETFVYADAFNIPSAVYVDKDGNVNYNE